MAGLGGGGGGGGWADVVVRLSALMEEAMVSMAEWFCLSIRR